MPLAWARRIAAKLRGLPERPRGLRGAGYDWERSAENALTARGYRILERNFRAKTGEIDFIAEENGVLCFVEVKGRSGTAFGGPADAVTLEKQRRIFRTAQLYLQRRRDRTRIPTCRFDVVAIRETDDGPQLEILRDAFRGPPAARRRRR